MKAYENNPTTDGQLDIKAQCRDCLKWTAGRLYFGDHMKLVDSDGGLVFASGWKCHNCLGEPWSSADLTVDGMKLDAWASRSEFVAAALAVTRPGYQALPFDEDLAHFEVGCETLLEHLPQTTPEEFDALCRKTVDAPAAVILPLLVAYRALVQAGEDS